LLCAVSVTFFSNNGHAIEIFYFTPTIANSRPSFVETEIVVTNSNLYRHAFYECTDCDIFEYARDFVGTMQSLPATVSAVVPQIHALLVGNDTSTSIECYKDKDEHQITNSCLSCSLEIDMNKNSNRTCDTPASIFLKVNLNERTTLDNKRTFDTIRIECACQYCNTLNTARTALHILYQNGLAQHDYDLTSSAAVSSFSVLCVIVYFVSFLHY
jgi:hypothetical protein